MKKYLHFRFISVAFCLILIACFFARTVNAISEAGNSVVELEAPPGIEVGALLIYETSAGSSNGWDPFKEKQFPSSVLEIRGRWLRVKGSGHGDNLKTVERWLNLDQLVSYRISN